MARLNEYYIFVKEEKKPRGVDVTSHPVEKGLDITSNVKRKPVTLTLEGYIVDANYLSNTYKEKAKKGSKLKLKNVPLYKSSKAKKKKKTIKGTFYLWGTSKKNGRYRITKKKANAGKKNKYIGWIAAKYVDAALTKKRKKAASIKATASKIESAIDALHQKGKKVKYKGRYELKNAIITSFDTKKNADIKGGCSFSMEIKEIRIALKAYKGKSNNKKAQVNKGGNKKRYHTVKKGETLYKIAKKYYGKRSEAKKIYKANKKKIDKRNKGKNVSKYTVYKGQKLLIP